VSHEKTSVTEICHGLKGCHASITRTRILYVVALHGLGITKEMILRWICLPFLVGLYSPTEGQPETVRDRSSEPSMSQGKPLLLGGDFHRRSFQQQVFVSPVVRDGWIVPGEGEAAEPVWGIENGLSVGLWPLPGPRGLIRIYTPYLEQPSKRVMNFIAVEPIVGGLRGYSELEKSQLDNVPGKAMWTEAQLTRDAQPKPAWKPAVPEITVIDGTPSLRFYLHVEPFSHGARPILEVTLRKDRPHEVAFRTLQARGGEPMESCVLTATMGNYARVRRLSLKEKVVEAKSLWPEFNRVRPYALGFAPPRTWSVEEMLVQEGDAIVAVTPDEKKPQEASYSECTPSWWRYQGKWASQYWKTAADPQLKVRVNGRVCYWGSQAEIPGGIAFENFELEAPFDPKRMFVFGISSVLCQGFANIHK